MGHRKGLARAIWKVAPESTPCMKLLFTFPDRDNPGLEVLFEDVGKLALDFRVDLDPVGQLDARYGSSTVAFCLRRPQRDCIRAKAPWYEELDQACWGWQVRYSQENPFDKGGVFTTPT